MHSVYTPVSPKLLTFGSSLSHHDNFGTNVTTENKILGFPPSLIGASALPYHVNQKPGNYIFS